MANYDDLIKERAEEVFQVLRDRGISNDEIYRVRKAFELAKRAHAPQKRKSGEPYIFHPIAVALILAKEFILGVNTVIAAFLHDVVEDTDVTLEDIRESFGEDVSFLVCVVTKEKKKQYDMSKQLDNFKQMLDSINYDIRALLLKLADRLHNMRTLESMRPDKQMKIAGETDLFYAPLANRLGLYEVKVELENLSLKYRCPKEFSDLEAKLIKYEEDRHDDLEGIREEYKSILQSHGIFAKVFITFRSVYSIWRRLQVSDTDFKHLQHKYLIKIIFPQPIRVTDKNRALEIYSALTDVIKEKPGSLKNYIDSPKENGYQSLHIKLINKHGFWEEVHIRSTMMEMNSRRGCIMDQGADLDVWIKKFRNILQDIAYHGNEGGFMENVVSTFYKDDIVVFTPNGNGVILPKNATAIDFAYEIHSAIGNHAQYARINGNLSSIKQQLKRGDSVEIGTNKDCYPKPDWLDYAMTYKAKRNINSYLNSQETIEEKKRYILCKKCNPIPGDEIIGFKLKDRHIKIHKKNCREAIVLASKEGDSIINVDLKENKNIFYHIYIVVIAIDRFHLLTDLVSVVSVDEKLNIERLNSVTQDQLVRCKIEFLVNSGLEVKSVIDKLEMVEGVDEVKRVYSWDT